LNRTNKAKRDLAIRMLKVDISIDEVALMSGLTIEELNAIKSDLDKNDSEANAMKGFNFQNMNFDDINK
jgi:hypothetical protein